MSKKATEAKHKGNEQERKETQVPASPGYEDIVDTIAKLTGIPNVPDGPLNCILMQYWGEKADFIGYLMRMEIDKFEKCPKKKS